jgi:hypothetical protein
MSTGNIIRIVQVALIALVAAFGISVVVAGHWWVVEKPPLDVSALGKQVVSGLQNQFDTAEALKGYGLHVADDIILINVNGNEYQGLVTVSTRKHTDVPVGVTLYADGVNMIYQPDAQSSAKLVQAAEKDKDPSELNRMVCGGHQQILGQC